MLVFCDKFVVDTKVYSGTTNTTFSQRMMSGEHIYTYHGNRDMAYAVKCEGLTIIDGIVVYRKPQLNLLDYAVEIHCTDGFDVPRTDARIFEYPCGIDHAECNMLTYCEAIYRAFARPRLMNKDPRMQYLHDSPSPVFEKVLDMVRGGQFEALQTISKHDSRLLYADLEKLREKWS